MKIIDVLNKMADGSLEDKFEFIYYGNKYVYIKEENLIFEENFVEKPEHRLGKKFVIEQCLNDEIEVAEKFKKTKKITIIPKKVEKLKEIRTYVRDDYGFIVDEISDNRLKLNEVIDTLNELIEKAEK